MRTPASSSTVAASPRHNAVCVVADHFWQAKRAIDALDVTFDGGSDGDLSTAGIDAKLNAALDAEHGVPALVRGRPERDAAGARRLRHRAALRAAAYRPCADGAGQRHGELPRRRGRGVGTDPVGRRLPGGSRAPGRRLARRCESECDVPRRQLRPQDRAGLCAAGGTGLQGGRVAGQAHPHARGGYAARRLSSERRCALARRAR